MPGYPRQTRNKHRCCLPALAGFTSPRSMGPDGMKLGVGIPAEQVEFPESSTATREDTVDCRTDLADWKWEHARHKNRRPNRRSTPLSTASKHQWLSVGANWRCCSQVKRGTSGSNTLKGEQFLLDQPFWLRLFPQGLHCSLVTGLQSARAFLLHRLTIEFVTASLSSQLTESFRIPFSGQPPGWGYFLRKRRVCGTGPLGERSLPRRSSGDSRGCTAGLLFSGELCG